MDGLRTSASVGAAPATDVAGVDPDDLATTLRVLGMLHELPPGHDDITAVKRATSSMYNRVKKARRRAARQAERGPKVAHDQAILDQTATGSPLRIDDETKGIPLAATSESRFVGELQIPRGCYICHADYTLVDAFYHWLCPDCAALSHTRRDQGTDLRGRRALLTGGRAKIGMYIALRLLRDGADLTITTRFPRDAARRFAELADSPEWIDRLHIVGIDLRDPTQVVALADEVAAGGPLDILINNACQTVRRSPGAYSHLVDGESQPLPSEGPLPQITTFDRVSEAHPAALIGTLDQHPVPHEDGEVAARSAADLTRLALSAGHASLEAHLAGTAVDAGGLLPDVVTTNSWKQTVDEVDPLELLEVQMCNSVAPFLLVSRLRPAMRAAVERRREAVADRARAYVVNVSAMEGQFSRRYKGAGHPHTNMAKAALNMLTRTSAGEMYETDRILMTAVDTGWITDERPHHEKLEIAAQGWHAPLDLVDGAARVYDPIVRGERGEDLYGVFLKNFEPYAW
ncbi:SDR family NAD(P)-dependent oxidoreductase [Janibacter anophelis]|uniref:SDR family NAD(P)-dependent oxidoreductase n=1 Tax=Janibacter anophelis TaxID=319054 RepID=UPI000DEFE040|nr:SDR family NAD(P)-dependent oxidoreductase [Janibacter anophelis]